MPLVQRKGWHANKVVTGKEEGLFRGIVDRDCKEVTSCFMNESILEHVLGLSKSTQLGSLLSYHSEETATLELPKAFLFFLGVMGPNMLDTSKSEEGNITYDYTQIKTKTYLGCYTPHNNQRVSINSHTQKDHTSGPAHTIF
jgi:hypothetical protein